MNDKKFNYNLIEGGYYHKKFLSGNRIQRFWHRHKFMTVLSKIKPDKSKTVLDVGCGPGTFISLMKRDYKKVYGIDIAKKQIEFAKKNFKQKNIIWVASDLEEINFKKNTFDYVCMIEVIEHLEHDKMVDMLKSIKKILKNEGSLVLTTPNYISHWPLVEFILNKISRLDYKEQHITKFTKKNLAELLTNNGFKIKSIETFFIASPFLAFVSNRLAKTILDIERKFINQRLGCLFLVEAKLNI